MSIAQSKVTAQGQVSVPAEVRKRLAIGPGSILEWEAEGDRIVVRRAGRHSSEDIHRALFTATQQPKSLKDFDEGIAAHLRRKHARR